MAKTIRSADFRLTARQILQAKNRPQTEPWEDWVTMALSVVTLFAVYWDGWLHNNSTEIDSFWSSAHIMMYAGPERPRRLDRAGVRQAPAARAEEAAHQHGGRAVRLRARARRAAAGRARRPGRLRLACRLRLREPDRRAVQPHAPDAVPRGRPARRDRPGLDLAPPGPRAAAEQALAGGDLGHLRARDGLVHVHEPAAVVLDDGPDRGLPGQPARLQRRVRPGRRRLGQARPGPLRRRDQLQRRRLPVLPVREHGVDRRRADLDRRVRRHRALPAAALGAAVRLGHADGHAARGAVPVLHAVHPPRVRRRR